MSNSYDVIVAESAPWARRLLHLRPARAEVLGLERFRSWPSMGSSHGMTRIIRIAYFEGSHTSRSCSAPPAWRETGAAAGLKLLHVTGSLDLARRGSGEVEASLQSCLDHGLEHKVSRRRRDREAVSRLSASPGQSRLWQPDGGFVASEKAIYALSAWHSREEPRSAPTSQCSTGDRPQMRRRGPHGARQLFGRAARDHLGRLDHGCGAALAANVATVRQAIGWFTTRRPELYREGAFPVFILTVEEGHFYGFPLYEHPGFKLGGPHFGPRADGPA